VAMFASAVLAAAVVPSQDPLTVLATAVPIYALYEGTIQLSRLIRPIPVTFPAGAEARGS